MNFIRHRINTLMELKSVPKDMGAEVDVRYHNNDLILHHDPFNHDIETPLKLEDFLVSWKQNGTLILNLKTEGIEDECIALMSKYQVQNWFFLDMSMPYFVKYATKAGERELPGFTPDNLAVRFSEAEPIDYAMSFSGQASWLWVDCFTKLPITRQVASQLKDSSFKLCLVSPELQGHPTSEIILFKRRLEELGVEVDAVCSKYPELWEGPGLEK